MNVALALWLLRMGGVVSVYVAILLFVSMYCWWCGFVGRAGGVGVYVAIVLWVCM